MANEADMGSWSELLHSSTKLLEQAGPSAKFPPLQRNLDQLEALSKKLKAKTLRSEAPSQSIAATRISCDVSIRKHSACLSISLGYWHERASTRSSLLEI